MRKDDTAPEMSNRRWPGGRRVSNFACTIRRSYSLIVDIMNYEVDILECFCISRIWLLPPE